MTDGVGAALSEPNSFLHGYMGRQDARGYGVCEWCGCVENTDEAAQQCPTVSFAVWEDIRPGAELAFGEGFHILITVETVENNYSNPQGHTGKFTGRSPQYGNNRPGGFISHKAKVEAGMYRIIKRVV